MRLHQLFSGRMTTSTAPAASTISGRATVSTALATSPIFWPHNYFDCVYHATCLHIGLAAAELSEDRCFEFLLRIDDDPLGIKRLPDKFADGIEPAHFTEATANSPLNRGGPVRRAGKDVPAHGVGQVCP
ncbi:hypothetical protein QYE76_006764 [Lolium multiflorum]|uniref:Uncharacterized protein n=1 Tax=Lolium multiflorum TaxID=4521 RepID=A0AAD8W3M5_LOLMU|nr:hypothetical protein QYE76_006764 [Lolium multiflorum]